MVKLEAIPCPPELSPEKVRELTDEYLATKKPVWKKDYIKHALLQQSHSKCCYCECKVAEESKYMEVEHFYPKSLYPEKVVEWENLLPACKGCNGSKGEHDPLAEPIIHPVEVDPKDYIYLKGYRFYSHSKTGPGRSTIDIIDLNNRTSRKLIEKRFQIGVKVCEEVENLLEKIEDTADFEVNERAKKKLRNRAYRLLLESCPEMEYSATASTILFFESRFPELRTEMINFGIWDTELEAKEAIARRIALPAPK